jgi:Transposase DDE domain
MQAQKGAKEHARPLMIVGDDEASASFRAAFLHFGPPDNPLQTNRTALGGCAHGTWTFAGSDFKRGASKWRCPTGECQPKSKWVKADRRNPLVPRSTKRWSNTYRGRAAVEREFGRLKNEYGLAPLRVRGLERVALHADLVMLARLSQALSHSRAAPLAA